MRSCSWGSHGSGLGGWRFAQPWWGQEGHPLQLAPRQLEIEKNAIIGYREGVFLDLPKTATAKKTTRSPTMAYFILNDI